MSMYERVCMCMWYVVCGMCTCVCICMRYIDMFERACIPDMVYGLCMWYLYVHGYMYLYLYMNAHIFSVRVLKKYARVYMQIVHARHFSQHKAFSRRMFAELLMHVCVQAYLPTHSVCPPLRRVLLRCKGGMLRCALWIRSRLLLSLYVTTILYVHHL
jgi:hypothetical protein